MRLTGPGTGKPASGIATGIGVLEAGSSEAQLTGLPVQRLNLMDQRLYLRRDTRRDGRVGQARELRDGPFEIRATGFEIGGGGLQQALAHAGQGHK